MKNKNSASIAHNMLEIRKRRAQAAGDKLPADTPLDGQENMVFEIILKQFRHKLIHDNGLSPADADAELQKLATAQGKRALLELFIEPALVMGVPYQYFVVNAVVCMVVFIATQNFSTLTALAPFMHLGFYLYYKANRARLREERINKIMTEGIKI